MSNTKAETVLLVGVGYEEGYTCSCVVQLSDDDDPVEILLHECHLSIENVDEVLVIRKGFAVEQVRIQIE